MFNEAENWGHEIFYIITFFRNGIKEFLTAGGDDSLKLETKLFGMPNVIVDMIKL